MNAMLLAASFSLTYPMATPQVADVLVYSDNFYAIRQEPMAGYWKLRDTPSATGKNSPPKFDLITSANWRGYQAFWKIDDSKLFLQKLVGYIDGKEVSKQQVLPKLDPLAHATWFTGKIQIHVGNYNIRKDAYECVITFHIENGVIKSRTFKEYGNLTSTWDGMPDKSRE